MSLTFDPARHEYRYNGELVISVTQYLKLAGFIDDSWYTEEARRRGEAVHTAIHYLNENDLDRASLHPIVRPYVAGFDLFVAETGFVPERVEYRVYDPIWRVAGTLDATGTWNLTPGKILIDFKTGDIEAWARLQLAAYNSCLDVPHRRFGLQLKPDGRYRLSPEYTDRSDISVFRSAVTTINWKIQHGLLVPEHALAA